MNIKETILSMAKPIEPTPILEGEDAKRFLEDMSNLRYSKKKEEFLNKCIKTFEQIKLVN